jgi:hypothetical protein
MLAWHQNITPLKTLLTDIDKNPKTLKDGTTDVLKLSRYLRKRQIAHYMQVGGTYNEDIKRALSKGIGVLVVMKNHNVDYYHAVIVLGYWRDEVSTLDPDDLKVYEHKRAAFDAKWTGDAIFLDYLVPTITEEIKPRRLLVHDLAH